MTSTRAPIPTATATFAAFTAAAREIVDPSPPPGTGPILVAAVGADAAAVLEAAQLVLGDANRKVIALAVVSPLTGAISIGEASILPPELETERHEALAGDLARAMAAVAADDARWQPRVESGDPAHVIARVAREIGASLIVMGIGRHGLLDRLVGTETALRTIQLAPCPVLVVAAGFHALPRTVVAATDFSPDGARAAACALPLLAPDATLHLVHVWQPENAADDRAREREDDFRAVLPARFAAITSSLALPPNVSVRCDTREGRPAACLLDFAAAHSADLIVAGRHGIGGLRRLLVGSVTSGLIRGTRCSVLVAPEPMSTNARAHAGHGTADHASRTAEVHDRGTWARTLREFSGRNAGRVVALEADDDSGSQSRDRGYELVDASFDDATGGLSIVLGTYKDEIAQRTFTVRNVRLVDAQADGIGLDAGLNVEHETGRTVLTFLQD